MVDKFLIYKCSYKILSESLDLHFSSYRRKVLLGDINVGKVGKKMKFFWENYNLESLIGRGRSMEGSTQRAPPPFHDQLVFFLDIIYNKKENNMKFDI